MAKKSAVRKTAKRSTATKGAPPKKGDIQVFNILLGGKRGSKAVKLPIDGIKTLKNGARQAYAKNPHKKSIGGGDKLFRFIKKA